MGEVVEGKFRVDEDDSNDATGEMTVVFEFKDMKILQLGGEELIQIGDSIFAIDDPLLEEFKEDYASLVTAYRQHIAKTRKQA